MASGAVLSLGATQTLTIGAPGVFVRAGAPAAIRGGTLDFDGAIARIFVAGELELGSAVTGASSLRKLGPGALTLTRAI